MVAMSSEVADSSQLNNPQFPVFVHSGLLLEHGRYNMVDCSLCTYRRLILIWQKHKDSYLKVNLHQRKHTYEY